MNKLKKILSSVLAFMMILSLHTNTAFASIAQDVKNTEYETEAQVLGALGIMVGDAGTGNFRPNDAIKRSEATKIGVALIGLNSAANHQGQKSPYPDVETGYWANGHINLATAHGLVIGDDTGTFRPEDQIKYSEAVTILIRALGYESQAKAKGGFPTGYISTARSIGLTKGLSSSADTLIKRGDVAKMAYNALRINLMEQTGFGTNTKFEVTDKTLLEDKLDTEFISGKVEAVGSSVLDGGSALNKDEIRINGKNYRTGNTDIRTILGFHADAYLNIKTKKIIAIVPTEGMNEVLNISAELIDSVENTASSKSVSYWKDKDTSTKASKANIEKDAFIVYNGKKADSDKFKVIDSGFISLLDTNSNGRYDIVFVNETVNYVVDDVYTTTKKISDKYSAPILTLDFEDESKTIILEKAGEYITLSDLKEWDVISFTISEGEDIIFGNVVTNPVSGKITEMNNDYVYVDGKKLSVASNYPHSFSLNDEGTFYLDFEGKIAAFDGTKQKNSNYAYLEKMGVSGSINKVLKFEIFTSEGKLETLDAASKITVNTSKNLDPEDALKAIGEAGKLVTFEKDADGKIKKITTSTVSEDVNEDIFALNMDEKGVIYRASSSKLTGSNMSVTVDGNTIIFDIPENGTSDDYAVRTKDIFTDGGLYDVAVFDVTNSYRAGAVIVRNSETKADESAPIAVVEKVNTSKDSDGETVHKMYAYSEGKQISAISKNDKVFVKSNGKLITEGDIIQFRTNAEGAIDVINVLFDTEAENTEGKKEISDDLTTVYGKVVKKFSDSVNIQCGSSAIENYEISKATVYVYNSKLNKNKISVGDISDVDRYENDGGMVFMKVYKDSVTEIVVIK